MRTDEAAMIDLAHEAPFELGGAAIRPSTREVSFGGRREVLEPRVMQVLVCLARAGGSVVSRSDLVERCWAGRIVGEDAINRAIAGVRRIATAAGGFAVETVVRVGYRLTETAPIAAFAQPPPEASTHAARATSMAEPITAALMSAGLVEHDGAVETDPAGAWPMANAAQEQLARLAHARGGRILSQEAAGTLVLFVDPADALGCAAAFQQNVAQLGVGVAARRAVSFRIGLHLAPAFREASESAREAIDTVVRLQRMAEPSCILLSDALRAACPSPGQIRDLGFHQLADVAMPVRIWGLGAASPPDEAQGEAGRFRPADFGDGRPVVAVLPFEHPPNDREQTYLADGIADDVIAAVSRFKWLFVLSRHSSLNYRRPDADIAQIRRDLGVDYVVTGNLLCRDGRLRLAVSLTDCVKGDTLWSRRFDSPLTDVFAIQDEVTTTIVGALEPALIGREEQQAKDPAPRSLKHWDLFIRGRWHFWQLTFGHMAKARKILTQALELKPDDAPTLSLLAYTCCTRVWSGWTDDPEAEIAMARRWAMHAVRADRDDAVAHYTLGTVLTLTGDLRTAIAEQRRALELNPNFAGALGELGRYLAYLRQYDEATAHLDKAIASSPGDAHRFLWFRDKAIAAFVVARYDEAVAFAHESVALRPDIFLGPYLLAACWAAAGSPEKGRQSLEDGRALMPSYSLETLKRGHPFAHEDDLRHFVQALQLCGWEG